MREQRHWQDQSQRCERQFRVCVSLSSDEDLPDFAQWQSGSAAGCSDRPQRIIAFHGDSIVCWRFAHLHGFTSATFAHIHSGSQWQSGHIVVTLSTGPRLHHQGCVTVSPALTKAIWSAPSRYYVNIHSTRYPGGAVRGQL
jgi:CHRD domain